MSNIKVHVKSPLSAAGFSLDASDEDTVSTIKQYLLALGLLEQPVSSFSLKFHGEFPSNETLLAELGSDGSDIEFEMQIEKIKFSDVTFQIDQLREVLGLSASGSTYVNPGPTRLHEIKRGSKKGKKLSEDDILELAELPEFRLARAEANADLGGKGADAPSITDPSIVARPNPLVPKSSAIELKLSHWQPFCRSSQVKLQGIIAFIYLESNDGKEWHFVATPKGFAYVPGLNSKALSLPQISSLRFTPTLIQAIELISPSTINSARKNGEKIKADPLGCVPVPQVHSVAPWLVGNVPDISSMAVGTFEQAVDANLRDWNEDYQSTRELEFESFSERIMRDRSLCHTASEFAGAALEGAIKIVEGAVTALNPYEDVESAKLYLSKGIFYTYGSDFSQAYAGISSEIAAKKAVKKGINGVEQLMMLNNPELCPVLTAVVDYCGRRLVAQAPVPGIFREVPLIVYGQSEDPEVVHSDEAIVEHMEQFASHFHLKKHPVTPDGVQLHTSSEVHGAKSTDGRLYAIDLHRMLAPDLLFQGNDELDLLRYEAVVDFYAQNPDAEKLNPDVWMSPERFPKDYASSQLAKDIEAVKAVALHVREKLAPSFVDSIADGSGIDPIDGIHLTDLMHRKGINMRHLGLVHSLAKSAGLKSLAATALEEAIARSLKTQLRDIMETIEFTSDIPAAIESFVSGFRGKEANMDIHSKLETRLSDHFGFSELPQNWKAVFLPRISLLRLLSLKTGLQWNEDLRLTAINPMVRYSYPRSLTAADAIEAGRLSLEAAFNTAENSDSENGEENSTTGAEKKTASDNTEETSSAPLDGEEHESKDNGNVESKSGPSQEVIEQTFTVIVQAVGIYTQIYGSTHAEVAHVLNQVATLFYEYGNDTNKAIEYVRKAITIAERVKGLDSYDVTVMYSNLAFFERTAGNWGTTIETSKRIISTIDQLAWPGYSDASTAFATVAIMLLQTQKPKLQHASLEWFARAIELAKQTPSGPTGLLWFQYAQAQIFQQDYKNAARSMDASYIIFKTKNGADDPSTKEVKGYLEQLLKITVSTAQNEAHKARVLSTLNNGTQLKSAQGKKKASKKTSTTSETASTDASQKSSSSKKNKKKSTKKKNRASA